MKSRCKWITGIAVILLLEYAILVSISIVLSYFEWSPTGYEPCGLQAAAWFIILYPLFVINLAIRGVLKCYYKIRFVYLLPPIIAGVLFYPAAYSPGNELLSLGTSIIGMALMFVFPIIDVLLLRRSSLKK